MYFNRNVNAIELVDSNQHVLRRDYFNRGQLIFMNMRMLKRKVNRLNV